MLIQRRRRIECIILKNFGLKKGNLEANMPLHNGELEIKFDKNIHHYYHVCKLSVIT